MDPEYDEIEESTERAHTPDEQAAFDERVGEMADYVNLLEAHDQALGEEMYADLTRAEASAVDGPDRLRATDRVEERWYDIRKPVWWAIGVLLVGILIAVIAFYGGGRDGASSAGNSEDAGESFAAAVGLSEGDSAASTVDAAEAADGGVVAGTWVIYADEAKSVPLYELTFQPNGPGRWVGAPDDPSVEYVVDSWSYTQKGPSVEVEIVQRITDARFGVDEPADVWLHLTLDEGAMTGEMEQDTFGYETVGESAGTVYRYGVQTVTATAYAEPKPKVE